jgi:serine/threonine-protein kinase
VGEGSMGLVYRAFDPLAKRVVAVKTLKWEYLTRAKPEDKLRLFLRETHAAASLAHPNVITLFDVGEDYFVMELLEGQTLERMLRSGGRLEPADTLRILGPVADGIDYAHSKGIIHRDIKPSNIIFVNNIPKFADIGLVTDIGQEVSTYGTPGYIGEGHGTPAGDVYSLGKVLYQVATGLDLAQFPEIPLSLVENNADLQFLQLNKIILKACEGDVTQRFKSAGEMHTSLLELQTRSKLA